MSHCSSNVQAANIVVITKPSSRLAAGSAVDGGTEGDACRESSSCARSRMNRFYATCSCIAQRSGLSGLFILRLPSQGTGQEQAEDSHKSLQLGVFRDYPFKSLSGQGLTRRAKVGSIMMILAPAVQVLNILLVLLACAEKCS